jgi:hypothetical protein
MGTMRSANETVWISQADAARIRGVTCQAISQLQKGRFRVFRIKGQIRLKRSEVEAFKSGQSGRPSK